MTLIDSKPKPAYFSWAGYQFKSTLEPDHRFENPVFKSQFQ